MLFRRKIEIEMHNDNLSIYIFAFYKNREVGRMLCGIDKEKRLIKIGDITCKKKNRGYGSLLMTKLIEFAKTNGFKVIIGWLSCVDKDHAKLLYHFYQKFGFEITPNAEGMKFADIRLNL